MVTGSDLASNAVPLAQIYAGKFNILPPPNSPWAALNGDFGLEMVGYMSRIADLPEGRGFPFRYYVHDPWWLNSPWLDRYGRRTARYLSAAFHRPDQRPRASRDTRVGRLPDDRRLVRPHAGQVPQRSHSAYSCGLGGRSRSARAAGLDLSARRVPGHDVRLAGTAGGAVLWRLVHAGGGKQYAAAVYRRVVE